MQRFFLSIVFCFCAGAVSLQAADLSDNADLVEAAFKYYEAVDKAKTAYETELRKALDDAKKRGNLQLYNALEKELQHTAGANGHSVTKFSPPDRTLFSRKATLQKAVETARIAFRKAAKEIAADVLKAGNVAQAREIDRLAAAVEPPRSLIDNPIVRNADLPVNMIVPDDWRKVLPKANLVQRLVRPKGGFFFFAWSPDDSRIASAGEDHFAAVFDAQTGKEIAALKRSEKSRGCGIAFTPDGKNIFWGGVRGEVGFWNPLQPEKVLWEKKEHNETFAVIVSPDGKTGISCGDNGIGVWSLPTGQLIRMLKAHENKTTNAAFFAKGKRLVSTSFDKTAIVWDTETWRPLMRLQGHNDIMHGVAISPDDRILATGGNDGSVIIREAQTGKALQKLGNFGAHVVSLSFSPDGSKLAVGRNRDYEGVFILDTKTWKPICFAPNFAWWNMQTVWSPDGKRLVTGCRQAWIFEMPDEKEIDRFHAVRAILMGGSLPVPKLKTTLDVRPSPWASFGRFTPDGKSYVANNRTDKTANVFDVETGTETAKLHYPQNTCRSDIHPDGKTIVTGTVNGKILIWNLSDGALIREIAGHHEKCFVDGIRFSPDGSFFASCSSDKTAAIWNTATGREVKRFEGHADIVWSVDISRNGKLLATCSQDGTVRIWDIASGRELHCMVGHTNYTIRDISFNNRGTVLASAALDATVVLWDVQTGKAIGRLIGSLVDNVALGFSPDDSRIVIGTTHPWHCAAWDTKTLLPIFRLPIGDGMIQSARFSPDGKLIATRSHTPIPIWENPTSEYLERETKGILRKRETGKRILLAEMPLDEISVWGDWSVWPLSSSRQTFENSFWAHAPSKYVFTLDGKWKMLETSYGIAKSADLRLANCVFIVRGNDRELFRSGEIKDALDRPLKLDISGVRRLELIVDPNGSNRHDQGIWFTPALSR